MTADSPHPAPTLSAAAPAEPTSATAVPAATPALVTAYTLTMFLSALLLFSVQPLFAKMALPVLGGSTSVWAVAVFFFQAALLAGYCYAHVLNTRLALVPAGIVHLAVCALAVVFLPIALPAWFGEPPPGAPYLWQLGMFTVAIGVPFIAVSANAPLLQAWFAKTTHRQAADPYFLYAASNLGSLIALLAYPFVLEPVFGLRQLSTIWRDGYVLLIAALGLCLWLAHRTRPADRLPAHTDVAEAAGPRPTWQQRLGWIGLAFVPAAMLTAFTTHVTTDVASAPLLWVGPLAIYLLTFVLVFRERAVIPPRLLRGLHLAAVFAALLQMSQTAHDSWPVSSSTGVAVFFLSAMVAHRTLYEARPAARDLTEFYLWMAFGGSLGGMFAALLAPKLFSEVFEYPLLLALSMACRPGALASLVRGIDALLEKGRVWAARVFGSKGPQQSPAGDAFDQTDQNELLTIWLIFSGGILVLFWTQPAMRWLSVGFDKLGFAALLTFVFGNSILLAYRHRAYLLVAAHILAAGILILLLWRASIGTPSAVPGENVRADVAYYGFAVILALALVWMGLLAFHRSMYKLILEHMIAYGALAFFWAWAASFIPANEIDRYGPATYLALTFGIFMLVAYRFPMRQATLALLMFAAVIGFQSSIRRGEAQRSYFGVYRVAKTEDGEFHYLMHGTTLHGAQRVRDADGKRVIDNTPATYYHPQGPMAQGIELVRTGLADRNKKGRYGVIGLGTGSLGCYAQRGERWRLFEIDPVVVDIAKTPEKFSFLANCLPKADIVLGDARLTLAKEQDGSFDLIIVDAFTSDAIPVHMMTAEALRLYMNKLTPTGVVILHISNRYLDLDGVLGATAPLVPELKGFIVSDDGSYPGYEGSTSTVGVFAKNEAVLAPFRNTGTVKNLDAKRLRPWTDDYSDVLAPLLARVWD